MSKKLAHPASAQDLYVSPLPVEPSIRTKASARRDLHPVRKARHTRPGYRGRAVRPHPERYGYLTVETQSAVASLQDHARQTTEAIREIGRHGIALARIAGNPVTRLVLRTELAHDIKELLERFVGFLDPHNHPQDCARWLN